MTSTDDVTAASTEEDELMYNYGTTNDVGEFVSAATSLNTVSTNRQLSYYTAVSDGTLDNDIPIIDITTPTSEQPRIADSPTIFFDAVSHHSVQIEQQEPFISHRKPLTKYEEMKSYVIDNGPPWVRDPRIQQHARLILLSSFLFSFGIILLTVGIYVLSSPPHPNFSAIFIVGGVIVFIPGVYHIVYVCRAYRGHEGYSFNNLPYMD